MRHHRYLIACVLPFLFPYSVFGDKPIQQYLSEGNDYLTSGKFNDALISFDAAIRKYEKKKKIETMSNCKYRPRTRQLLDLFQKSNCLPFFGS